MNGFPSLRVTGIGLIALALTFAITTSTLAADAASRAEKPIESLAASGQAFAPKKEGTLRVLMVGGGSSHDFEKFFHQADKALLKEAQRIDPIYTENAEEAVARLAETDVLVLSANHRSFGLSPFQSALKTFADAGKGIVIVHAGVWNNWPPATGFNYRFVGGGTPSHGAGTFTVSQLGQAHPVLEGVAKAFEIQDELYRPALGSGSPVTVLAETSEDPKTNRRWPSIWLVEDPKAKIVCIALGHGKEAHENKAYQQLLRNSVRWVASR